MFRVDFLAGLLSSGAAAIVPASPSPGPSPTAVASPDALAACDENPVLRYDRALEFKQRALDAPDVDLQTYRGNIVLLNFFATWCGPCQDEQPDLVDVANQYYASGLRVIGLNYAEPDDRVRKYRDRYKIPYPIVMGAETILRRVETNSFASNMTFPISLFLWDNLLLSCYRVGAMHGDEIRYKVRSMLDALHAEK